MSKRVTYDVISYGEWTRPRMANFREQCCDCGLIHRLDFRIVDGEHESLHHRAPLIWHFTSQLKARVQWDLRMLERGSLVNSLDLTFERKRIMLDDFVLPSWTWIEGKTFIDCDLIGPANMYFLSNNQAMPIRPPRVDAVWLEPNATFNNGFVFNNCIFRNCSFQRITMFASIENYDWKDNPNINWISFPPTQEQVAARIARLNPLGSRRAASPQAPHEAELHQGRMRAANESDGARR